MPTATLLVSGATSALTGAAFLLVARALARRAVSPENRLGQAAGVAWWGCLGAYLALQGGLTLLAGFGRLDEGTYLLSRLVAIPLLCAATWGLTCHLAFLHVGRKAPAALLGALYAGVAALFFYATFAVSGHSLVVEDWVVRFADEHPLMRLVYVLVGVPPIFAGLAYLALLRRTDDPLQRLRIRLLSGGILAYVGGGLAARLAANDLVVFLTLVPLGLAAAGAALLAHYPPRRLVARLEGGPGR